jgi:hypothetical protein
MVKGGDTTVVCLNLLHTSLARHIQISFRRSIIIHEKKQVEEEKKE